MKRLTLTFLRVYLTIFFSNRSYKFLVWKKAVLSLLRWCIFHWCTVVIYPSPYPCSICKSINTDLNSQLTRVMASICQRNSRLLLTSSTSSAIGWKKVTRNHVSLQARLRCMVDPRVVPASDKTHKFFSLTLNFLLERYSIYWRSRSLKRFSFNLRQRWTYVTWYFTVH